jgi:predicted metal-dependent hydrolase
MEEVKIIRSNRRSISLQIEEDGSLLVRAPRFILKSSIMRFIKEKESWIDKHKNLSEKRKEKKERFDNLTKKEIKEYKEIAKDVISKKVKYYADLYDFKYGDIKINSAKKRWGSCNVKNTLNFTWRLMFCPDYVVDYVVIHELCHIKEKNHSRSFWNLVEKYYPDFKKAKRWFKENT